MKKRFLFLFVLLSNLAFSQSTRLTLPQIWADWNTTSVPRGPAMQNTFYTLFNPIGLLSGGTNGYYPLWTGTNAQGLAYLHQKNAHVLLPLANSFMSEDSLGYLDLGHHTTGHVFIDADKGAGLGAYLDVGATTLIFNTPTGFFQNSGTFTKIRDNTSLILDAPVYNFAQIAGPNRAAYFDGSSNLTFASTTITELNQLSGVTSNVQTQLNSKLSTIAGITAGGDLSGTYVNPSVIAIQGKGITLATGYLRYNGSAFIFDNSVFLTANQSITFTPTGDVTGSASGATSLTPALTIGSNKVSYAKMQQASTLTLLGNPTGGTANIQEITLGTGLSFSGSVLSGSASGVTSVALSMPSIFTVSGSPVTGAGTLTAALNTQSAHKALIGPSGGIAAIPTFRSIYGNDLSPTIDTTFSHSNGATNQVAYFTGDKFCPKLQ